LECVCVCNFGLKQNHNATWRWVWNNKKSCYKNTTKFASFLIEFFLFFFSIFLFMWISPPPFFLKCMYKNILFIFGFFFQICVMHPQIPWYIQLRIQGENNERIRSWVRFLAHNTSGVEGHVGALDGD
jgi:hypothetical protein